MILVLYFNFLTGFALLLLFTFPVSVHFHSWISSLVIRPWHCLRYPHVAPQAPGGTSHMLRMWPHCFFCTSVHSSGRQTVRLSQGLHLTVEIKNGVLAGSQHMVLSLFNSIYSCFEVSPATEKRQKHRGPCLADILA